MQADIQKFQAETQMTRETEQIKADAKLRDLPIIMITSRIAEKHREHARALGVDHYLGKPYSEDELVGLVRQYSLTPVNA